MLSLVLFLASGPQTDPAVQRFEAYMREHPTLKVDMGFKHSLTQFVGAGTFVLGRPTRFYFSMKWSTSDYTFSATEKAVIEIERGLKTFRELAPIGRLFIPDSSISHTPDVAFPDLMLTGRFSDVMPPGTVVKTTGTEAGPSGENSIVSARYSTMAGSSTLVAKVDPTGKLVSYSVKTEGAEGSSTAAWTFSNYVTDKPIALSFYEIVVPAGYGADTLPPDRRLLNVGESFPVSGWRTIGASDRKNILEKHGKKALFVILTSPDCEISAKAALSVAALTKELELRNVPSVAVSIDPFPAQKAVFKDLPGYFDPDGALLEKLQPPGTPIFYILDAKGVVTRLWYGFDAARQPAFQREVRDWAEKVLSTKLPP